MQKSSPLHNANRKSRSRFLIWCSTTIGHFLASPLVDLPFETPEQVRARYMRARPLSKRSQLKGTTGGELRVHRASIELL